MGLAADVEEKPRPYNLLQQHSPTSTHWITTRRADLAGPSPVFQPWRGGRGVAVKRADQSEQSSLAISPIVIGLEFIGASPARLLYGVARPGQLLRPESSACSLSCSPARTPVPTAAARRCKLAVELLRCTAIIVVLVCGGVLGLHCYFKASRQNLDQSTHTSDKETAMTDECLAEPLSAASLIPDPQWRRYRIADGIKGVSTKGTRSLSSANAEIPGSLLQQYLQGTRRERHASGSARTMLQTDYTLLARLASRIPTPPESESWCVLHIRSGDTIDCDARPLEEILEKGNYSRYRTSPACPLSLERPGLQK